MLNVFRGAAHSNFQNDGRAWRSPERREMPGVDFRIDLLQRLVMLAPGEKSSSISLSQANLSRRAMCAANFASSSGDNLSIASSISARLTFESCQCKGRFQVHDRQCAIARSPRRPLPKNKSPAGRFRRGFELHQTKQTSFSYGNCNVSAGSPAVTVPTASPVLAPMAF